MVWNLAARVKLIPDRKALARNRRHSGQVPVEVEIEAKGSRFREHLLTARGESSHPLSQRLGKFLRLARWRIPEERAAALWDELGRLDRVGSVRELAAGMAKGRAILR